MATLKKRAIITLCPEWEPELDKLKKEQFYNSTKAEMFRYLIKRSCNQCKERRGKIFR